MSPLPLRSLLSGSLIYGLGGVTAKAIPLLLLPFYTAHLLPMDYGVVSLLQLSGTFLSSLFTFGFGTSIGIVYFPEVDHRRRDKVIATAVWVLMMSGAVMASGVAVTATGISSALFETADYAALVEIAGAATALSMLALPMQVNLQFSQKPTLYVIASISSVLTTAFVGVITVVRAELGAVGLVSAWCAGQLVLVMILATANRSVFRLGLAPDIMRELFRNGWPMVPSFLFLFILQEGVRYPLQWFSGLHSVGVYAVGASLGFALSVITNAFISAWTPFAMSYATNIEDAPAALGRVTFAYVVVFGIAVLAAFYFSYPVVHLLVEPAFYDAAPVVGLCASASYLGALFLMLLPPAYFAKEPQCVTRVQAVSALIACLLAWFLVPAFKEVGAGFVVAFATLAMVVLQYLWNVFARRGVYVALAYPIGKICAYLAFIFATAAGAGPLMSMFPRAEWVVAFAAVLAATIVAVAGFFSKDDFAIFRKVLGNRNLGS